MTQKWLIIPTFVTVMLALPRPAAAICADRYACGSNSPEVDHYGLGGLYVTGQLNDDGIALVRFAKGPFLYTLSVSGGRIRGTAPGVPPLEGAALRGAYLVLSRAGALYYKVTIADVAPATYASYPHDPIETYLLVWAPYNSPREPQNVCTAPPSPPRTVADEGGDWDPFAERSSMRPTYSVVYEGDRIRSITKTIDPAADLNWFNIGCAGHTLAKLHLTHNSWVGRGGRFIDSLGSRQAVLKMLVADYCGDGTPFTVFGQPLVWADDDTMTYFAPAKVFEARWTPNGAGCLDVPRVAAHPTMAAHSEFPDIETAIVAHCPRPPPCSAPDPNAGNEPVQSANP